MRETWPRTGNRIGVWMYRHLNGQLSSVARLPSLRISVLRLSLSVPLGRKKLSHSFREGPFVFWVPGVERSRYGPS